MSLSQRPAGSSRLIRHSLLLMTLVLLVLFPMPSGAWDVGKAFKAVTSLPGTILRSQDQITGGVTGEQVFGSSIDRLEQANARSIDKLGSTLDQSIERLRAGLDSNLKTLDISLETRLTQFDQSMKTSIDQLNSGLDGNIENFRGALRAASSDLDTVLSAQIKELDEVFATRIGNLDVVAAKAADSLHRALLRLLITATTMGLLAAALWRAYVRLLPAMSANGTFVARLRAIPRRAWTRAGADMGLAVLAALILVAPFYFAGPSLLRHSEAYLRGYNESIAAVDFTRARFHAAQLMAVDPSNSPYHGYFMKAEALRDLFARPALVSQKSSLADLLNRLEAADYSMGAGTDLDIQAAIAFVLWRAGYDQVTAHRSAQVAARALQSAPSDGSFGLMPVARNCLANYLVRPLTDQQVAILKGRGVLEDNAEDVSLAELRGVLASAEKSGTEVKIRGPAAHIIAYDTLVRALDEESTGAYIKMIEAHGDVVVRVMNRSPLEAKSARNARTEAAREVIGSWARFSERLRTDPTIQVSAAGLAAFLLNDAVVTRAKTYLAQSDVDPSAEPSQLVENVAHTLSTLPVDARRASIPPRVEWSESYASGLGRAAQLHLEREEAARFVEFEARLNQFEVAYVAYRIAEAATEKAQLSAVAEVAALSAISADLFVGGESYAVEILESARTKGASPPSLEELTLSVRPPTEGAASFQRHPFRSLALL